MTVLRRSKTQLPKRPPPPTFSLSALADDCHLTQYEVAQVKRQTESWVEKCRLGGTDGLQWVYIGNRPRCLAGSLKAQMKGSPNKGPPVTAKEASAIRQTKAATRAVRAAR